MVFAGKRRGRDEGYVYLESIGGGAGARYAGNGMDGVHVHVTNSSNLPIEPLEIEYDLVVDEYALVDNSSGAGQYRGGMGIARQISAPNGGVIFTARSDGHKEGAPGVAGGTSGRPAHLIKNAGTDAEQELDPMVANLTLDKGETIRLETPGGGGYGDPAKRAEAALAKDLRDGRISAERAEALYGPAKVAQAKALI
jgi:N-methylhydantoinase B